MALDNLKISEGAPAFDDFAVKHNALVSLLSAAKGTSGIKVMPSEGNIVVALDIDAVVQAVLAALATADVTVASLEVTGAATVGDELTAASVVTNLLFVDGSELGFQTYDVCPSGSADFLVVV